MATAALPINELRSAARFGASLRSQPEMPEWMRRSLIVYSFPKLLRFITENLSGERTGRLSQHDAQMLYGELQPLYTGLVDLIETWPERPWLVRVLLSRWIAQLTSETDLLGDVLETLAWGFEPALRTVIDESIARIDYDHNPFADRPERQPGLQAAR